MTLRELVAEVWNERDLDVFSMLLQSAAECGNAEMIKQTPLYVLSDPQGLAVGRALL